MKGGKKHKQMKCSGCFPFILQFLTNFIRSWHVHQNHIVRSAPKCHSGLDRLIDLQQSSLNLNPRLIPPLSSAKATKIQAQIGSKLQLGPLQFLEVVKNPLRNLYASISYLLSTTQIPNSLPVQLPKVNPNPAKFQQLLIHSNRGSTWSELRTNHTSLRKRKAIRNEARTCC
jgi:hypothetical protein